MGSGLRELIAPTGAVVRRTRASAGLVAATFVMTLTATGLVAAVPVYVDAIDQGGFRASLARTDPDRRAIDVTMRTSIEGAAERADVVDGTVRESLPGTIDAVSIVQTDSYGVGDDDPTDGTTITSLATLDADVPVLRVVRGDPDAVVPLDVVPAALVTGAAEALGVDIGDEVVLDGRDDPAVRVRVVAIVAVDDDSTVPAGIALRTGVATSGSFVDAGPFLVSNEAMAVALDGAERPVAVRWRGQPRPSSLSTDDIAAIESGVRSLPVSIAVEGDRIEVSTTLDEVVTDARTALDSTTAVVAVVLVQLVGLALYGVSLAAHVLASSRAGQTTLLLSRGARTSQLTAIAGVEALLVVVPAAAVAPFVAVVGVRLVGRWGPMRTSGIDLAPQVSMAAWSVAAFVAAVAAAVIVWPSVTAWTRVRSARRSTWIRRGGVDLVLAAAAAIAVWSLGRSPVATPDASGELGVDPVLVMAPALGVLAAAVVTVRLIGVGARAGEAMAARGRGLSAALAGRELSRAGGRTNRTAVLVMSTLAIGTYALATGSTWERSVRDQADAAVGADLVVTPVTTGPDAVDPLVVQSVIAAQPGVARVAPVSRLSMSTARGDGITAIATDVATVEDVLRARDDITRSSIDLGGIRSVGTARMADLGAVDGELALQVTVDGGTPGDVVQTVLIVSDGVGSVHRLALPDLTVSPGSHRLERQLVTTTEGVAAAPTGPLTVVAVELTVPVPVVGPPGQEMTPPLVATIDRLAIGDRTVRFVDTEVGVDPIPLSSGTAVAADASAVVDDGRLDIEVEPGSAYRGGTTVRARVRTVASLDAPPLPALATPALLADLGLAVGDRPQVRVGGASTLVEIVGTIERVPFAASDEAALLVDWASVAERIHALAGRGDPPTGWAIAVADAAVDEAVAGLRVVADDGIVDRRAEAERLGQDPATIGVLGSLALAVAASLVITLVGLALTAVVGTRERSMSYSVLRSMGAPTRDLRRWLLLEMAPLVATAVVAGLVTGTLLAGVTIDSVTLSRAGTATVPPPVLVVPVAPVAALVVIAGLAGVVLPLAMARTLGRQRSADILRIGDTA